MLAVKLENEQDQIAEYLFNDIAEKVAVDKVINGFFGSPYELLLNSVLSDDPISKRMTQLYFTGYWGKYDISIKCFNSEGLPVNTGGDPTWNLDYFNILIREESNPTYSDFLYFSGNTSGRISYIGRIPVFDPDNKQQQTGTIVINLTSKALQGEAGFPELLISDKIPQKRDISNYSYAHYKNGLLVNQFGEFSYLVNSISYKSLLLARHQENFQNFDGYSHLFYKTGDDGLLIISIRNPGILEFITLFSYLFSFYGIGFIFVFFTGIFIRKKGRVSINFKSRIQVTVVAIVVTTMLLIGGATVYYIFRNYVTNLNSTVNDRLKSMLISIQDELSKRSLDENEISDEMNYTFSKLANTLAIDFNIFTSRGRLVYSTQPKIYDQAIVAQTMNRLAIDNLSMKDKSLFVQFEEIGKLQYLSAYEPVRNNNYQTIGYINLPYFARQDELKKNISSFLVALINIYVLLFAFSIFITFIISSRITKPLQIIQQRLGKIKLGKRNELIEWTQDDEIGALVKEYNRMVEELSESADLLARSERESAWREMAKQVAHEIKNPLTPMKLSVQHLERAWKEKSPNLDGIMQRVSQTLIEQIDTLSNIATEFSNFAKMPKANNDEVELSGILKNTVTLYSENESATITYYQHQSGNYMVFSDREQLLRVFSNLIKNAIQSIPDGTKGHVHVELKNEKGFVIASIKDNGVGISDNEAERIFTPNFTTKTGGTGLGLAMVKNIIEQANGKVWFQTKIGEGTTFYVSLPEWHADTTSIASD
ncbi:MAG: HAMP domain-containing histidine kinase [Bacteroidetes bacterium]|nr:HAMP domain-containing histidine kinase [Bacteroidota bacterium]